MSTPKIQVLGQIGPLVPVIEETATSGSITVYPNEHRKIPELTGETTISLSPALEGWDNEWIFTIKQGETAQTVALPTIEWYLGIAPAFAANTTTNVRLSYKDDVLIGVWL